jgi:hypothetical protein
MLLSIIQQFSEQNALFSFLRIGLLPIAFLLLISTSCQDVIELDLPEGEKRVIINGRVSDTLPVYVEIYATVNYLSSDSNPMMCDVNVVLFENNEPVAELQPSSDCGKYEHPFRGTEGNYYHIEVSFPEGHPYFPGKKWQSTPEIMSRVPSADSTYSLFYPAQPFIEEGYYAFLMFTEPAGRGDHYRVRLWKNDTLYDTQYDLSFFNDEFIDGYAFNDNPIPAINIGSVSKPGDYYKVELSSISSSGYKFLSLLQQQTVQVGSTFDPPPAPIFGNIFNANNPDELGLGYFFVSKLTYTDIEIKE